uniref:Uncharacterized protein n=1 Tax=Spongospora subterranea TaxID=70186 RepID=A0A0H5QF59_9EUKA|eukprot:CRZ00575.1 hypothetical protein [Spongospora subterranea]
MIPMMLIMKSLSEQTKKPSLRRMIVDLCKRNWLWNFEDNDDSRSRADVASELARNNLVISSDNDAQQAVFGFKPANDRRFVDIIRMFRDWFANVISYGAGARRTSHQRIRSLQLIADQNF